MEKIPTVKLNNGIQMPVMGLSFSKGEHLKNTLTHVFNLGFRNFHCRVEKNMQIAVITDNRFERNDLFISANHEDNYAKIKSSLTEILEALNLSHLDLYILDPNFTDASRLIELWREMEEVQRLGLTRSIGLRKCDKYNLERILQEATVFPVVNEIEVECKPLVECCQKHEIRICHIIDVTKCSAIASEPKLSKIAESYGKTQLQLFLRHYLDTNKLILIGNDCEDYLQECVGVFDFCLAPESVLIIRKSLTK